MRGQNQLAIYNKSLPDSRFPVVGVKNLKLHHAATVDDSYIDTTNLVTPPGLTNPSPTEIAKLRLKDFSNNWLLTSNLRPLWMEGVSFEIVTNNSIRLLSGYEALEDEVFTIQYFNHMVNGVVIADVRTPGGSGLLLNTQVQFNLGEAVPIKDLTNQWPMQVYRGQFGTPQLRVVGNNGVDGNYRMIDRGDGYCQVIEFTDPAVGDEIVMWSWNGALGERPNLSTLQQVDKLHGIVDKMRQDMLEVTGYDVLDPTRYDGGVPTQSDLKAFGDSVYQIRKDLDEVISKQPVFYEIINTGDTLLDRFGEIRFNLTGEVKTGDVDSIMIAQDDVVNSRTRFNFTQDCFVDVGVFSRVATLGRQWEVMKNDSLEFSSTTQRTSTDVSHLSAPIKVNAGDYLTFTVGALGDHSGEVLNTADRVKLNMKITKR